MREYEEWLKRAEQDLDTADYLLKGDRFEASVFFLQQSAEKALKALYVKRFKKILRTHDLVLLSKELNAPENIVKECKELTLAYQYSRYPDVPIIENLKYEALDFLKVVKEILKWVREHILKN